jgi:hypothetical protein
MNEKPNNFIETEDFMKDGSNMHSAQKHVWMYDQLLALHKLLQEGSKILAV